jgi:hypothetical protein
MNHRGPGGMSPLRASSQRATEPVKTGTLITSDFVDGRLLCREKTKDGALILASHGFAWLG